MNSKTKHFTLLVVVVAALGGCSSRQRTAVVLPANPAVVGREQGVSTYTWEEPMVDTVQVPPGLDPEGHYYRPAHNTVVEIRQGRWKHHDAQ
jgi:uncharacterized lipoprotein YmbA